MTKTLKECDDEAIALIRTIAGIQHINDELITDVSTAMELAELTWDPAKASKKTHRYNHGKYVIMNYFSKIKKAKKHNTTLLSSNISYTDVPYEDYKPLMNSLSELSPIERKFVTGFYLDGKTIKEIAQEHGCSKQNVHFKIQTSLKKLKTILGDKYGK